MVRFALATLLLACTQSSLAAPPSARDLSPISGLFGIPDISSARAPLKPGEQGWRASSAVSSHSLSQQNENELLLFDGETVRFDFEYRRTVGAQYEIALAVPWLNHSSGGLDNLVDNWHSLFGLPNGIRPDRPQDSLLFAYRVNGNGVIERRRSSGGLGDVELSIARILRQSPNRSLTARLAVKLPTGDDDELTGTGATDIALGLSSAVSSVGGRPEVSAALGAGVVFLGKNSFNGLSNRNATWFADASLEWRFGQVTSLYVTANGHGQIMESGLRALGDSSLQLSMGLSRRLGLNYQISAGFSEDIRVESYPDITFRLQLSRLPVQ